MSSPPIGPDLPGEVWRPVPGNELWTEVSNMGRIRTTPRVVGTMGNHGYLQAVFRESIDGYGTKKCRSGKRVWWEIPVHRIVAFAFLGKHPKHKNQINHKDGNKLNNAVSNLEYCTARENSRHAFAIGLSQGRFNKRKLTTETHVEIRRLYRNGGWTHNKLAVKYNISATHVGYILHRSPAARREKKEK